MNSRWRVADHRTPCSPQGDTGLSRAQRSIWCPPMTNRRPLSLHGIARGAVRRAAPTLGYDVVEHNFNSPLPDVERLPDWVWSDQRELPGIDLRLSEAGTFLTEILRPYIAEFDPPRHPQPGRRYYLENGMYQSVDAESLYAILRHFRPQRVIELGSGASSNVIAEAREANERDGHSMRHTIFDPFPFTASPLGPVEAEVHRERTEDVALAAFTELEAGDVLFADTTHTVKTGGDVPRLILDVFPVLRAGVIVHVHDIFLPYDYPRQWVVDERRAWAEQYLLQAFLAFNQSYEVLFPAHALSRGAPAVVAAAVPSFHPGVPPGAFWMRKIS